jgi:16S rRNA (uracil1498-N3)-methyltransferase
LATPRRYFANSPIASDSATLTGAEAHHLRHVMWAAIGAEVILFDGSGVEFHAQVASVGRAEIELTVVSRAEVDRELPVAVTLGVALPKGERQRLLVEKAVELGVGRLVPLITQRAAVRPTEQGSGRLERSVIEASKQCGRNRLMQIASTQTWPEFIALQATSPPRQQVARWVAHPTANRTAGGPPRVDQASGNFQEILLAVGPEGGLTDDEVQRAAQAGWSVVDLGPRILRIETAALVMATLAAAHTFWRQTQPTEGKTK